MNIVNGLKVITLGFCLSLLVIPVTSVYAQAEEEEEEPIQARPNPMDSRIRMKGADRSWDPTDSAKDDGRHGDGKVHMRGPASRAAPAQGMQPGMQMGPQGMQPGMPQMQGIQTAPQVQDDGEHGDMAIPQQMGH